MRRLIAHRDMNFSRAFAIADEWVRDGIVPGISIAVARHGELLATHVAGKKAAGGGGPVTEDTLYPLASVTKPFTATLVLRLVDRGLLTLDEPVRRFVPELGTEWRELNLRDLLRHTSGFPNEDPAGPDLWAREASAAELITSMTALPAAEPPGQRVRYSNLGYWIAGFAAAGALGTGYANALRTQVLEPLRLTETFIAPDDSLQDRLARRYGAAKFMNGPYGRALASPSGGLFATARDLVRFAGVFLPESKDDTKMPFLSRPAIALMTTNQTGDLPGGIEGLGVWPIGSWALGWQVKGDKTAHWTGDLTSPATFCHLGQSGTLLWADPATGLACAILANRDLFTGWTATPARWARLNNAIVAGI